jgi:putative oxidoreductase
MLNPAATLSVERTSKPETPALWRKVLETPADAAATAARVALAGIMLPHGAQKLLGLFGGYGFSGTMEYFTGPAGLPWIVALFVILAESLGSLLLLAVGAGRLAALAIAGVMIGAIVKVHWSVGFFMDWNGQLAGEGFEFHLLALGLAAVVLLRGSGAWSLDRALTRR